jgi:hypothetical protein
MIRLEPNGRLYARVSDNRQTLHLSQRHELLDARWFALRDALSRGKEHRPNQSRPDEHSDCSVHS